jgi:signal transduction histidine kinase/CheY-like chemotaxis protein
MIDKLLRFQEKDMQVHYDTEEINIAKSFQKTAFYMFFSFILVQYILRYLLHEQLFGNVIWNTSEGLRHFMNQTLATAAGLIGFAILYWLEKRYREKYLYVFEVCYTILFVGFVVVDLRILWSDAELQSTMNVSFLTFEFMWKVYVMFAFIWTRRSRMACIIMIFLYITATVVEVYGWQIYFIVEAGLNAIYVMAMLYYKSKSTKEQFVEKYHEVKAADTMKWILNEIPESIMIMDKNMHCKFKNTFFTKMFPVKIDCTDDVHEVLSKITDIKTRTYSLAPRGLVRETTHPAAMHNNHPDQSYFFIDQGHNTYKENAELINKDTTRSENFVGSSKKISGTSLYSMLADDHQIDQMYKWLNNVKEAGSEESLLFDCKYREIDDRIKSIELKISLAKFYGENCLIFICRDTTERDYVARLEDNNKYKDRLLASVSHELRTPLNGNLNLVDLAICSNESVDEIKQKFLIPAQACGTLLLHFISDIVDYSEMIHENLRLVFTKDNLKRTIEKCIQLVEIPARKKGLMICLTVANDVPEMFVTDHGRLARIMLNLLNNAVKFTYSGSIEIMLSVHPSTNIEVAVRDTGIGIKPADQKRLFDPGNRAGTAHDHDENNHSSGVGLGLHISKYLAEKLGNDSHGGISVESTFGQGSTFKFLIEEKSDSQMQRVVSVGTLIELADPQEEPGRRMKSMKSTANLTEKNEFEIPLPPILIFDPPSQTLATLSHKQTAAGTINSPQAYTLFSSSNGLLTGTNIINSTNTGTNLGQIKTILDNNVATPRGNNSTHHESKNSTSVCCCNKVLAVDDDCFNLLAIEAIFKQLKIPIDTAFNGVDAIKKVHTRIDNPCCESCLPYKVIFMDCAMPIMDGFEATKNLKEQMREGVLPNIPIVGCTAFTAAEKVDHGMALGMAEFVFKPLSRVKVDNIVSKYMG